MDRYNYINSQTKHHIMLNVPACQGDTPQLACHMLSLVVTKNKPSNKQLQC